MKNKIKFVYFDVGGVMLRWKGLLTHIAEKHKQSLAHVESIFFKYDTLSCRGKITSQEVGENIFRELGVKMEKGFDFQLFSMDHFSPIKQTHRFAKKLSTHLPIGLLTNIYPGVLPLSLAKGHVPDLKYTAVVESCRIGLVKPEREMYLHAQKKAQVPHEHILFIDDFAQNIQAAKTLGWQTVIFDTDNPEKSLAEIRDKILT